MIKGPIWRDKIWAILHTELLFFSLDHKFQFFDLLLVHRVFMQVAIFLIYSITLVALIVIDYIWRIWRHFYAIVDNFW